MLQLSYQYIRWHYTKGVVDLVNLTFNFLWFAYNFFSVPILLRTLFVPFHRLQEKAGSVFQFGKWAEAVLITSLMRVVGFVSRVCVILLALLLMLCVAVLGIVSLAVWLAMPLVVTVLSATGILLISVG